MAEKIENLYQLCEEVCTQIAGAPNNYVQERWACNPKDWLPDGGIAQAEACGTAFCRGGWMINILDHQKGITRTTGQWQLDSTYTGIERRASKMLKDAGISQEDITALFSGIAISRAIGTGGSGVKAGSSRYVKEGVRGMREFMEQHKDALKAYRITGKE